MGNAICTKCEHYRHIIRNKNAPQIWYHHYCAAAPYERMTDPTTGEEGYGVTNAFGRIVYLGNDEPYMHCRDVNQDGNCEMFELKSWVSENAN